MNHPKIFVKGVFFLLVCFLALGAAIVLPAYAGAHQQDKLTVTYFYAEHCKVCLKIKNEVLPALKDKYSSQVEWVELNTTLDPNALMQLIALAAKYTKKDAVTPSVFVGDALLTGKRQITAELDQAIYAALKKKTKPHLIPPVNTDLVNIFKKLSLVTVLGSGLIDGVNPCAFAVIVFFVSFLAVYGYRRREIMCIGICYCLAVFLTYFLLGFGFFKTIYALSAMQHIIQGFYYLVAGFCYVLALLAFYDFVRYKQGKSSSELLLQLPAVFKKQINLVIGSRLRDRSTGNIGRLVVSSLVIGFLVSLLEAVCTGQVYVPTIVFILRNTNLKIKAFLYLFLYNLMFVVPLLLVFALSFFGFSSQKFNSFLKRHLGTIKIVMAILFVLLGSLIMWVS